MDRINRARVLLEQALAKQKGVGLGDIEPIVINPQKHPGIASYVGNLNYRFINNALRASDVAEWDELYNAWKKRVESVDLPNGEVLHRSTPFDFGDNVLRASIKAEEDLKINPSPYDPKAFESAEFPSREEMEYGLKLRDKQTGRLVRNYTPPLVVSSLNPEYSKGAYKAIETLPGFYPVGTTLGRHHFSRLSYESEPLVRALHFDQEEQKKYIERLTRNPEERGFSSFSVDLPYVDSRFGRRKGQEHGVLLVADMPNKIADLPDTEHPYWTFNRGEGELLYLPGTKFEVQDILSGQSATQYKQSLLDRHLKFREKNPIAVGANYPSIGDDPNQLVAIVHPKIPAYYNYDSDRLSEMQSLVKQQKELEDKLWWANWDLRSEIHSFP